MSSIPVLVFLVLRAVVAGDFLAFTLSVAVALDNALLSQAHFALSDSILITLCLLSILVFVDLYSRALNATRASLFVWVIWGVLTAAAALVKLTGAFVLILVPLYAVKLLSAGHVRRATLFGLAFSVSFVTTTAAVWQLHFSLIPNPDPKNDFDISVIHRQILEGEYRPDPVNRFVIQFRDAMIFIPKFHNGVPQLDLSNPDEIGSPWYQWPFGGRTIPYRWDTLDGRTYRYIYLIGNPVTWLISLLGVVLGSAVAVSDILFRYLTEHRRHWIYIFSLLYWAYMLPIMFIRRVMYLYHYLPALIIGIIMFGILFDQLRTISWKTKRHIVCVSLVGVIATFWVYKPFTFYEPLTADQFQHRNVWTPWDLRCVNCWAMPGNRIRSKQQRTVQRR